MKVERIQKIHELGFLHNDIKLENILVGNQDPDTIYLIDFGLTSGFMEEDGITHIEKKFVNKFSGNFMFASVNSCKGNTKSRRDDIQSVVFVLIYLLNNCQLPWDSFYQRFKRNQDYFKDMLMERLRLKYSKQVLEMTPHRLKPIVKEINRLQFQEIPPYQKLLKELKAMMTEEEKLWNMVNPIIGNHQFEWVLQQQGIAPGRNPENFFNPNPRDKKHLKNYQHLVEIRDKERKRAWSAFNNHQSNF